MIFNETKPIYLQISDLIADKIISKVWVEESRIPSVREMGSELEVNPNTVMRAYESLADRGIIFNRRGIGFFVSAEAYEIISSQRVEILMEVELKSIARQMNQLGVTTQEVMSAIKRHLSATK